MKQISTSEHDSNSQLLSKEQPSKNASEEPRLPKLKLKLNPNPLDNGNKINSSQNDSGKPQSSSMQSESNIMKNNPIPNTSNNSSLKKPNNTTGMISSKSSSDLKSLTSSNNSNINNKHNLITELNLVKPLKINLNKTASSISSSGNSSQFQKPNPNPLKSSFNNNNGKSNLESSTPSQNNLIKTKSFNHNKNSASSNLSMNNDVELGEIVRPKSTTPTSFDQTKEQVPKLVIKPGNKQNQSNTSNLESLNLSTKSAFAADKFDPKFKKTKSNLNPNVLPQFTTNQLTESNPLLDNLLHNQSLPPPPFDPQDPSTIPPEALPFLLSLAHHASQSQFPFPGFDQDQLNQIINQSNEANLTELNVNAKKRKHTFDNNAANKSYKSNMESSQTFLEESRSSSSNNSNSNNGMGKTSFNNSL